MHVSPADLSVSDLRTALVSGWRIEPSSIAYAPVGFGSHHWTVVEPSSRRWFVTADAVTDSSTRLAELSAALRTAFTPPRRRTRVRRGTSPKARRWAAANVGTIRHCVVFLSGRGHRHDRPSLRGSAG